MRPVRTLCTLPLGRLVAHMASFSPPPSQRGEKHSHSTAGGRGSEILTHFPKVPKLVAESEFEPRTLTQEPTPKPLVE